jgi:hypothetical protein
LEPTDPANHYRLTRLYRQQNREEDAKREMALYLKYKSILERLETIYKGLHVSGMGSKEDLANGQWKHLKPRDPNDGSHRFTGPGLPVAAGACVTPV